MKIEMIKSNTLTNGIKDISDRYGPSALILRNIETDGQEVIFIAHEKNEDGSSAKLQNKSSILKEIKQTNSPSKASQNDIELVKQAIKSLPNSFNLTDKDYKNEASILTKVRRPGDDSLVNQETIFEKHLHKLLEETPTSNHIKNLVSGYVAKPSSKNELLSQIESGVINNLPNSKDIRLDSQIHVLAGGHGAGKTSIALKIAAQLRNAYSHNVSIVSFGKNVGINKSKLRALSDSLDIPNFYVKDHSELAKLLYLKQNNNIYIIDLEPDSAQEAIPFIRGIYEQAQFHLVTPTDISLPSFWVNCKLDKWDSIILTRLDSPLVPWAAVEALSKFKIPLSIGSNGSEITSGLVKVTTENISHRLTNYINDRVDEITYESSQKESLQTSALH